MTDEQMRQLRQWVDSGFSIDACGTSACAGEYSDEGAIAEVFGISMEDAKKICDIDSGRVKVTISFEAGEPTDRTIVVDGDGHLDVNVDTLHNLEHVLIANIVNYVVAYESRRKAERDRLLREAGADDTSK